MEENFKIKIQDSVQWYEGQLLYPHHYQQMRYEIQQQSLCYLSIPSPWYWGVRTLEVDEALLSTGVVRINKIFAVFPDGSVLEKEGHSSPSLELDLSSLKESIKDKEVTIHLAIVKRQADTANTAGEFSRYTSVESSSVLDENTGENPINIARLALRPILVLEEKLSPRLSAFPLIKISLQDGAFKRTEFMPPSTVVHKDGPIGHYLKTLITKIRRHIGYLSTRLQGSKTKDLESVLDHYSRVYTTLASRILALEVLYASGQSHPYEIYTELSICAGGYCGLIQNKLPPILGAYNHNDLQATFAPLISFINEIIDSIKNPSISIPFHQDGRVFYQEIAESYLASPTLVVGIRLGTHMSAAEGATWIKGAVISCDSAIKEIKEKRILGAEREIVEQIPEMGLVTTQNHIFIKVNVDPSFIKGTESLKIFNPSDREDARPDELFLCVMG